MPVSEVIILTVSIVVIVFLLYAAKRCAYWRKQFSTEKGKFDFLMKKTLRYFSAKKPLEKHYIEYWAEPATMVWAEEVCVCDEGKAGILAGERLGGLTLMKFQAAFYSYPEIKSYIEDHG